MATALENYSPSEFAVEGSSSFRVTSGTIGDDPTPAIQLEVIRHTEDGEVAEFMFCVDIRTAYRLFMHGTQVCLTVDPTLDEIPEEWFKEGGEDVPQSDA